MSKGKRGCAVVAVTGAVLLLAVIGIGFYFFGKLDESVLERSTYDSLRTGQPEVEVRELAGRSLLTKSLSHLGGPREKDWSCEYYISTLLPGDPENALYHRLCFSGGKLVEKTSFEERLPR